MLKTIYFLTTLLLIASAQASVIEKVDCAKIQNKELKLNVKQLATAAALDLKDLKTAVNSFYACFAADVQPLVNQINEENNNACDAQAAETTLWERWVSDRVDIYGSSGGSYSYQVRQAVECSGLGTGLFEGIAGNVLSTVSVQHSIYLKEFDASVEPENNDKVDSSVLTLKFEKVETK
ncbi:MAG: hypothetical protein V4736_05095 [Bdellovibrionota bacterium]